MRYPANHLGRSKILLRKLCLNIRWTGNKDERRLNLICLSSDTSPSTYKTCFHCLGRDLASILCGALPRWPPRKDHNLAQNDVRRCIWRKQGWAPTQFSLLCARTPHLGHTNGVCIVQEGTWHSYFVYPSYHAGRTESRTVVSLKKLSENRRSEVRKDIWSEVE